MNYLTQIVRQDLLNSGPDHQYYDITFYNKSTEPKALEISENRTQPFIDDPSNYYLSIIRFHLDTSPSSLPLFIPEIQTGQSNVNLCTYSFTLKYKTFEKQTFVIYIPENEYSPIPNAPTTSQDLGSEYYFLYSFSTVIDLLNNCLSSCFDDLKDLVEAGSDTLPTNYPPWIQYDFTNNLILNCDVLGYDSKLTNPIEIYMNIATGRLLNGFQTINKGFKNISNGKNYKLVITNSYQANILELTDYNSLQIFEEFPSVNGWSPVKSILFTSGNLPITGTITGAPTSYGSSYSTSTSQNNSERILTDFSISNIINGKDYLPSVNYVATGNYRLIPMEGRQSLHEIKITVKWMDHFGNCYPLKVSYGCNFDMKIMFRKKNILV
jgi:hypothetical protein